jgi:hypothetical protein
MAAFGGTAGRKYAFQRRNETAVAIYYCKKCGRPVRDCGCGPDVEPIHFASLMEGRRAAQLILLRNLGKITQLRFHPKYELKVNGKVVGSYVADFDYIDVDRGNKLKIEEVKPENWEKFDKTAKLKIALFEACYASVNLTVTIVTQC